MDDLLDVAIMMAVFALGIGLVQVLSAMIERHSERDEVDGEPPDDGRLTAHQSITLSGPGYQENHPE